jgi:hypothetical protein
MRVSGGGRGTEGRGRTTDDGGRPSTSLRTSELENW